MNDNTGRLPYAGMSAVQVQAVWSQSSWHPKTLETSTKVMDFKCNWMPFRYPQPCQFVTKWTLPLSSPTFAGIYPQHISISYYQLELIFISLVLRTEYGRFVMLFARSVGVGHGVRSEVMLAAVVPGKKDEVQTIRKHGLIASSVPFYKCFKSCFQLFLL